MKFTPSVPVLLSAVLSVVADLKRMADEIVNNAINALVVAMPLLGSTS